jgi:DNA-binding transcriptional LysR family regulator
MQAGAFGVFPTRQLEVFPMTLTQLRYFLTLTDHLNFTRAADALYISQTTLSQHISKLEEELQTTLFLRNRSGLVLTPEGQYLKSMASMVVNEIDALPEALKDLHSLTSSPDIPRTFSIAVDSVTFSRDRIMNNKFISTLRDLSKQYPKTEVLIHCVEQEEMLQQLLDKSIDVAVGLVNPPSYQKVKTLPLKQQPINLVMRYQPEWKTTMPSSEDVRKSLNSMDIYTVNFSSSYTLEIKKWMEDNGCVADLHYVNNGWHLQMLLALDNVAIFVPAHNLTPEFDLIDLYTVAISELSIPRYVAWNTENNHPLTSWFAKRFL